MKGVWLQWIVVNTVRNDIVYAFPSEAKAREFVGNLNREGLPDAYVALPALTVAVASDVSLT